MKCKTFLCVIVPLLQIVGIILGTSKNQCVSCVSVTIAILLVLYSAINEFKLMKTLKATDKEFQIERNCKGEIISHAKIDCGTYDSNDDNSTYDNHENN